ncbi:MAG TPA: SMI1/KNR4 family protein [Thermoanaerobaculia bacterium]
MALVLFALVVMIKDRISMMLNRREADLSSAEEWLHPEFDALESFFGMPIPDDVRWLYMQHELIRSVGTEKRSTVDPTEEYVNERFLPATVKSVKSTRFDVPAEHMPIAIDEAGNYYAVQLGSRVVSPVIYVDHEQSQTWMVAHSLRHFIDQGR